MENYKDTLAKLANQMNTKIATETATPEQNELKKKFGRIFQTNHCSLRLAERNLEIPRDIVRKRLVELERAPAALYHKETKTFIRIEPTKMKDWLAITAYEVNGLADARRKTQKMGLNFLFFNSCIHSVEGDLMSYYFSNFKHAVKGGVTQIL